jgi:hypothetical protein
MPPRPISFPPLAFFHPTFTHIPVSCALPAMDHCLLHTSPTTSEDQTDPPSRGLLDQRVFYLDQIGSTRLKCQHATVLINAVAIAHRLVFSLQSLHMLYSSLHRAFESEMLFRKGWKVGISPHIAPALQAIRVKDGMHVMLDRKTHQDGYVRIGEPRGLRVRATVSHVRRSGVDELMIQLLEETIEAARKSKTIYHMHLFHLALVLAHLICRSIRLTIVGPGHIGDWIWEVRYFGGYIERILRQALIQR